MHQCLSCNNIYAVCEKVNSLFGKATWIFTNCLEVCTTWLIWYHSSHMGLYWLLFLQKHLRNPTSSSLKLQNWQTLTILVILFKDYCSPPVLTTSYFSGSFHWEKKICITFYNLVAHYLLNSFKKCWNTTMYFSFKFWQGQIIHTT